MEIQHETLLEMYKRMRLIRQFEEAAETMKNQGEIPGCCHSSAGQEAAVVGACMALSEADYVTGTHRSHGHPIGKGADVLTLMAELKGKVTGVCKGLGGSMHFTDTSIGLIGESGIVGGGIPIATGAGLSAKVRQSSQVCLCFFGDGAVNEGAFHESLNMASLWKLPVIYFCENNGYSISTSLDESHGQPSIARRADAYGIKGITIDGQDTLSVYASTLEAVQRARNGNGPTLIEARTHRFDKHMMGMPDEKYRDQNEIEQQRLNNDPIVRHRAMMIEKNVSKKAISTIENRANQLIAEAVKFAEESAYPLQNDPYQYLYSQPLPVSN